MRRATSFAVAAAAVFAMTACDQFSTFERLGVSLDGRGSVQIHYLTCGYERLVAVKLFDANEQGEEDDELVWEIRSEAGADGGVFPVGSRPPGFMETVELDGSSPPDDRLIAAVEIADSVGAAVVFTLADLEAGSVWITGKPDSNIDAEAFEQQARDSCRPAQ